MTQIYLAATSILIDLSYVCTMLKHLKAAQWIMYQFNTLVPEYIFMNEGRKYLTVTERLQNYLFKHTSEVFKCHSISKCLSWIDYQQFFCDSLIQVFTWWHSSSFPICIHLSIKKSPQGPNKENNPILSIKNVYKTFWPCLNMHMMTNIYIRCEPLRS